MKTSCFAPLSMTNINFLTTSGAAVNGFKRSAYERLSRIKRSLGVCLNKGDIFPDFRASPRGR